MVAGQANAMLLGWFTGPILYEASNDGHAQRCLVIAGRLQQDWWYGSCCPSLRVLEKEMTRFVNEG
ncbi:hypothetical protein HBI56_209410 [Parastagonospora nodorum]|uniref:Uncharacterized protein n=1 Tax=Phaeosphaeria nodorum (strain SN15 / ATCC MYA-4574 / FGSC 10173) TaxID=321614 RepID=A0A7U2FDW4_PHANO|nr:hypothetical protein HBH56_219390 [Parastagonospora nodorum]QRD01180.1 hypothetical protein JI435_416270 [Parastagonospora nodorum SN15]KAH3921996.1 hypothetical protein HBH54_229520 [Parastagonospora nodorum]KAH3941300.1 hypothetical protein HBH53_203400 [Parastagonospora nodorum]KAH3958710.1 hypothetical protein HBH51_206670 [Parastagonospora nodorum]